MRFDRVAKVLQVSKVSDGYGGTTSSTVEVAVIGCIITPLAETAVDQQYGTTHLAKWKVITLDNIEVTDFLIESEGIIYKVLEDRPYKLNRRVMICEVDINGN